MAFLIVVSSKIWLFHSSSLSRCCRNSCGLEILESRKVSTEAVVGCTPKIRQHKWNRFFVCCFQGSYFLMAFPPLTSPLECGVLSSCHSKNKPWIPSTEQITGCPPLSTFNLQDTSADKKGGNTANSLGDTSNHLFEKYSSGRQYWSITIISRHHTSIFPLKHCHFTQRSPGRDTAHTSSNKRNE